MIDLPHTKYHGSNHELSASKYRKLEQADREDNKMLADIIGRKPDRSCRSRKISFVFG